MKIPFGKYQGLEVEEVTDIDYLGWMYSLDTIDEPLREAINKHIDKTQLRLNFGRYKGKTIKDIDEKEGNVAYLDFLYDTEEDAIKGERDFIYINKAQAEGIKIILNKYEND